MVPYLSQASSYTLTATDQALSIDATTAPALANLPTAVGIQGKVYSISKSDASANAVTVTPVSGQTIDSLTSQALVFRFQFLMIVSDGSNWRVISSNYHGKELGYAAATSFFNVSNTNTTVPTDASLNASKIPGLSITVVGAGRPVSVEFSAKGGHTVANTPVSAVLLINASQVGGDSATVSSPAALSGPATMRSAHFKSRQVLTAGTSYTFEVGAWTTAATGQFYANTAPSYQMYLAVVGQ